MKVAELFEGIDEGDMVGRNPNNGSVRPTTLTWWVGNYNCEKKKLISLKGTPTVVKGFFNCSNNKLTSLEHGPKECESYVCSNNDLTSLHNIHKIISRIDKRLDLWGNPIKSHVLGLLKIKDLKEVELDNIEVEKIINKYLPEGNIIECQSELIEAGFEEYAQL
jgi:hypothetical protein